MPTLSWRSTDGNRSSIAIAKAITTIGAAPENDVVVRDLGLAPYHVQLVFDGKDFSLACIEDGDDFVLNGKKKRRSRLAHQDRFALGRADFVFSMLAESAVRSRESGRGAELAGLHKLQEFTSSLFSHGSVDEVLDALMDGVIEITGAAKGFLILFEDGEPIIKVARNLHRENLGSAVSQLSDSIVAQVVQSRSAIIISDAQSHDKFAHAQSVINLKLSSVMCAPLQHKDELLGLIYLGNDTVRGLFEPGTLELLKVFAAQASLIVQNALLLNELKLRNEALSRELDNQRFGEIIGASPVMEQVFKTVEKVAATEVSVLIGGETGTGKELIAREIHRRSQRRQGPFVTVNCGAIPETLMESEFFGHVKGAFTGAEATRPGKFQAADKGTIFLDEIGEMPMALQVKILRVLQEHQVVKVGATKTETLDIRVLAATNRNLEEEIRRGAFREDLYYRLNVIHIELPALRERGDDVLLLARYLLQRYADEFGSAAKGFSPGAMAAIRRHSWPGNVRELENRIKKAVILCDGSMVGPDDLDLGEETARKGETLAEARERFQRQYILDALEKNGGNRVQTAEELDVDPRTIYRYLEKA